MARTKKPASTPAPSELTAPDIENVAHAVPAAPRLELPPLLDPDSAEQAEARYQDFAAPADSKIKVIDPDARQIAIAYLRNLVTNSSVYTGGKLDAASILIEYAAHDDATIDFLVAMIEGNGNEHADRRRAATLILKTYR